MSGTMKITMAVNGEERTVQCSPWKRLLDVLREDLRLTGTKEGCGEGECGACTVLLNDHPVNSCLVAAGQCDGGTVGTVEGVASQRGGQELLHAVQTALIEHGGAQCGICTPGIAVCAASLIKHHEISSSSSVLREQLAGNICRCTGYQLIVEAVLAAVEGQ